MSWKCRVCYAIMGIVKSVRSSPVVGCFFVARKGILANMPLAVKGGHIDEYG